MLAPALDLMSGVDVEKLIISDEILGCHQKMSAITLTLFGSVGNRKLYGITFHNRELDSSFDSQKEPTEPKSLEVSRFEARKNVKVVERNEKSSSTRIRRIQEKESGAVKF